MTKQDKRCINKVIRLVRAIREEAGINPKNICSMTVESTFDWARFGEPERYHAKIALANMYGPVEDFYNSGKRYGCDPCQGFFMEDDGHGNYTFTAFFPSVAGVRNFSLPKEDVFKEE